MNGGCARELPPLDVAAARECHRCLGLQQRALGQRDLQVREQDEKRIPELALERGWTPAEDVGWPRRALSFLTENGTDGSDSSVSLEGRPEAGPLSSTRRSLLDEPDSGGLCVPALWPGCTQEPLSLPPWPCRDPRGSAVPPLPLASSTLLSGRDQLQEGPLSSILVGRTRGPHGAPPKPCAGDIPGACPQFAPVVSPRQPQRRISGGQAASPRSPLPCSGLSSCLVAPQTPDDIPGDIRSDIPAQHCPAVPWDGAVPNTGLTEPGGWDPAGPGDSSSPGDNTECFVSALEPLEPSEAGGCWGAQHPGPPGAAAPSPARAAPQQQLQGRDFGGGSGVGSDAAGLLARFRGCSLRVSPPRTLPGAVTSRGWDPSGHRHVTPRSRSRLRAVEARLRFSSSSSSSSLFEETPPMPRRPRRLRVPRDAATSSGRCVTPRDGDVAGAEGQGTGPWGDTQILPGVPGVYPGVGSSGPTVLFGPGDKGHLQNSPGSGPTVLLCPGDKGHLQNSLSLIRGCPQHSPTVPAVLRSHGHPQESPSAARGPPSATSCPSPEGGSGWQHPSPLGISQPQWPHRSFRHPLDPRPPGSASGKLGTPSTPLSSTGSATPHSEGHPEAEVQDQGPPEYPSPGTEATSGPEDATGRGGRMSPLSLRRLSDRSLRRWLRALGDNPGPVTELTRSLYRRRLQRLAGEHRRRPEGHSPELVAALRTGHIPDCGQDELALAEHFERPECGRPWREGRLKSSFNYLLLDPRITQNLPQRSPRLSPAERFQSFVTAVFYVGKGTRARPFCHLGQALRQHRARIQGGCPKVQRILEIWASGHGVVALQCFHHRTPTEAHTRESCMLEALGLQLLTNERRGPCYGVAAAWAAERRQRLGVLLLHRAMSILLAEGECQLRPGDIPGGP